MAVGGAGAAWRGRFAAVGFRLHRVGSAEKSGAVHTSMEGKIQIHRCIRLPQEAYLLRAADLNTDLK